MYSGKTGCNRAKWLYSCRGCIRAKVVVFGLKWLFLDKVVVFEQSGCIWAKVVVFGQKWMSSCKVVVIKQSG